MASIDVEDENILTTIFKNAFPASWQENPDFLQYLVELSSYGVEKLAREPDRLAEESAQVLEETQDLAFHNYTTFIQTADCSKEIFQDIIEKNLDNVLEKLPPFAHECNKVVKKAQEISSSRQMNTLTLQRHTQLLEILEMPQLMDTCVRNGYYEEALELASHVKRLEKKLSHIPVIMSIVNDIKNSTQLMLNELLQQLRTNLQLPACLRVIGYLRQMDVFTEAELRIKFLQARDSWFQSILNAIPQNDAYLHITKTIEASRVHLFDIITQYRAIFSDEDPLLSVSHDNTINETALFHGWVVRKVSQFLNTLERDLHRGVGGRLDSILGQCMYFGLSFSRVGADFRGLLAPIFQTAVIVYFQAALAEANKNFEENMQSYNLLGVTSTGGTAAAYGSMSQAGQSYPPTVLLDFYPLASYCNHVLVAFNELRLCAPVNVACQVADALQRSLLEVNRVILAFFRAEETTFNAEESDQFGQFCATYVTDLLPYLNKCLHVLFSPSQLAGALGVSVSEMTRLGNVGMIDLKAVISQVEHLIPMIEEQLPPSTTTTTSPVTMATSPTTSPTTSPLAAATTESHKYEPIEQSQSEVAAESRDESSQSEVAAESRDERSQSEVAAESRDESSQSEVVSQAGQKDDQSDPTSHQTAAETAAVTGQSESLEQEVSSASSQSEASKQERTDSTIQKGETLVDTPTPESGDQVSHESGVGETESKQEESKQEESSEIDLDNLPFEFDASTTQVDGSQELNIDSGLAASLASNVILDSSPKSEDKQE